MMTTNEDLVADGYYLWEDDDPYENLIGPFYLKPKDDGTYKSAFCSEERHCNASGAIHGGLLMSFADYALFAIAKDKLDGQCVTVGFNAEFVSAGYAGEMIEAHGDIIRSTRSMLFVRGQIITGDRVIITFSGILKRVKSK